MRLAADLVEFVESGTSICVGTADSCLRSEIVRAVGARAEADAGVLTIYLNRALATRTLDNLRENPRVAVTFSRIIDHRTLQLKGDFLRARPAKAKEKGFLEAYLSAFGEQVYVAGLAKSVARRVRYWPSTAVEFRVTDAFLQTPGPSAGTPYQLSHDVTG